MGDRGAVRRLTVRPRLLDLFCCEGGASRGYAAAGFQVEGVDRDRAVAKRYPFNFHFGDWADFLAVNADRYDAFHASPPCQGYSITAHTLTGSALARYPLLIPEVRAALQATGKPYIIENVVGAPLHDPTLLCGSMFGLSATDTDGTELRLERHRLFESNLPLEAPGPCRHDPDVRVAGIYGGGRSVRGERSNVRGGYTPTKNIRAHLLGVKGMSQLGLSEAIPPAYTEHLGRQLIGALV